MKLVNENELYKLIESKGIYLVDFFTEWCGPCKMLSPILEELSKEFTNINFIKINIDHNQEVASKFNVRSIPTVYLFKDSKIVSYFVGFKNKDQIIEFLKEVK